MDVKQICVLFPLHFKFNLSGWKVSQNNNRWWWWWMVWIKSMEEETNAIEREIHRYRNRKLKKSVTWTSIYRDSTTIFWSKLPFAGQDTRDARVCNLYCPLLYRRVVFLLSLTEKSRPRLDCYTEFRTRGEMRSNIGIVGRAAFGIHFLYTYKIL